MPLWRFAPDALPAGPPYQGTTARMSSRVRRRGVHNFRKNEVSAVITNKLSLDMQGDAIYISASLP
jgi:hypothetical protein